jgi:hypothetical protein
MSAIFTNATKNVQVNAAQNVSPPGNEQDTTRSGLW